MSDHAATHDVLPGDPPHIHHMDPPTAYEAAKFGMWLFLGTEILLFAVLFASFFLYRWLFIADYHSGSKHLNMYLGALNTLVLLISSFTAARAVDAAQEGDNKKVIKLFGFTIFCGGIFLVVKFVEYRAKYLAGLWPGKENFTEYANFLGFYFCMTGLHGLHVIIGMGILVWVLLKARKNRFSGRYYTPVELGALYWHLVDLIWIYLFPLLYLVG
jgi:cytochrome c oxidase subunit 3